MSKIPLSFELSSEFSEGQIDSRARFISRFGKGEVVLTSDEAVLTMSSVDDRREGGKTTLEALAKRRLRSPKQTTLRIRLLGAAPGATVEGLGELESKSHYFFGAEPGGWRTNVPHFAKVRYHDVYPGVDMVFYGNQHQLEYDFVVAPGADPSGIKLSFEGPDQMRVDEGGDLVLLTSGGEIRQHRALVYQEVDAVKRTVPSSYVIEGSHEVGFEVGDYDTTRPLVIDPVLSYSTLAGDYDASGGAVAVDSSGCVYLAGRARGFPTTVGAFQSGQRSGAFVAKLNAEGTDVVYSTFISGTSGIDSASSIAVDREGNVYVTGTSYSPDFPITPGAYESSRGGDDADTFVAKLSPDGSQLLYSTLLGGDGIDIPNSIVVDSSANAYVVGFTTSVDFPTTPNAFQSGPGSGSYTGFVTKLNAEGTSLVYSTLLTGTGEGFANGVAVNNSGNAYVTGYTTADDFPVTPGAAQTKFGGDYDAFVTELNESGTTPVYSTFLGGEGFDFGYAIALDSSGNAYLAGETSSHDFPTTKGALQRGNGGSPSASALAGDGFVAKLNPSGSALVYSTYLGGRSDDEVNSIAVDSSGSAYLTGSTSSTDFPVVNPFQRSNGGGPYFRSTDGGGNWSLVRTGLTSANVTCFAIAAKSPSTTYAGTVDNGVFKSVDGGNTWDSTGLTGEQVFALAIDPDGTTLYAGCSSGVRKSTNGGRRWSQAASETYAARVLLIDPINSGTIYAGIGYHPQSLLKSTDGGASWQTTGLTGVSGLSLAMDPLNPSALYAGATFGGPASDSGGGGVAKSTDGGATWKATTLIETQVTALAVEPRSSSTVFAGDRHGSVFKSTDGGESWIDRNLLRGDGEVRAIAVDPRDDSRVFVGTTLGVFRSKDGGRFWHASSEGLLSPFVNALAVDPQRAGNVYVGTGESSEDAFVAKLNPDGSSLLFSTYVGGTSGEGGSSVAVDALGRVYIAGTTDSTNFATTRRVLQSKFSFGPFAFLLKIGAPRITSASMRDKTLILAGESFDKGAVVLVNGQERTTKRDAQNPTTTLIVKKVKGIGSGGSVLRVRNSDDSLSPEFPFTPAIR